MVFQIMGVCTMLLTVNMMMGYGSGSNSAPADKKKEGEAGGSKRSKLAQRDSEEEKGRQELLTQLAKLTLSNTLQSRIQKSITTMCYKCKTESVWIQQHREGRQAFVAAQQKAKEKGLSMESFKEQHGTPESWATNSLLKVFLEMKKGNVLI